jgi:hypothetical protein
MQTATQTYSLAVDPQHSTRAAANGAPQRALGDAEDFARKLPIDRRRLDSLKALAKFLGALLALASLEC